VTDYQAIYEQRFVKNLQRYLSLHKRIKQRVEKVLANPYLNTELLVDVSGGLNLQGCRSARVDYNFRLIFVICEECRKISECEYCFCTNLSDNTVVFLTVGPHERAYDMR
jgi:mRNA-degrading endonuclease RelE of RelBE toxin-antitoxin system